MPIYFPKVSRNTIRVVLTTAATLLAIASTASAQSEASVTGARGGVAAGSELDNYLRYLQSMGKVPLGAWGLRPFSAAEVDSLSKVNGSHPWKSSWMFRSRQRASFLRLAIDCERWVQQRVSVGKQRRRSVGGTRAHDVGVGRSGGCVGAGFTGARSDCVSCGEYIVHVAAERTDGQRQRSRMAISRPRSIFRSDLATDRIRASTGVRAHCVSTGLA